MPTRDEFEDAAVRFTNAAEMLENLSADARSTDTSQVLRGGLLGRRVAERVASAADSALLCRHEVLRAADTCQFRADAIAAHESELDTYDREYVDYIQQSGAHLVWLLDETGAVPYPGEPPPRPIRPDSPGDWADVQRS